MHHRIDCIHQVSKRLYPSSTLAAELADDAEHADVVITSDKCLATSTVIANASIDAHVDIHTVVAGSFKVRITNKSGGALANDSTMVLNYTII